MILELKENHHMNESGTSLISSTLMEILEWFLEELEAKLVQESSDIHAEAFSLVKQQGRKLIMNSPLLEVNTEHKIKKYLLDKCGLVKPQEIVLGSEYNVEVQSDSETISEAEEKAMIVPMVEQLTQLFTNREIYNYTFTAPVNQSSDNVIRNAKDGSVYKNHRICQLYPDALLIQLYIDDVEMVNPLGSHTKKNKITVFYWNLLNLPNHMRSSLKAINLYGFALSTSIKKFGYQEMLRNFLQTIQQLETPDGLLIRLGNEPVILHGTLISVSGDGLALNEIGGFKSIGSLTFKFCRNCDLDRNEIFKSFVERNIRAFPQHKERVKKIQAEPTKIVRDEMCKTYGINGESIFSTLQNFDITKGLPQDLMHNLLEGVQEVEIRALLFRLIEDFKVLTYQNLNHLLKSFPYPESLKSSKPSPIDRAHVVSGKLRQSASQMISLLCVMPFLLEPYHDDQTASFIDNFILLAKISNILLSFEVDRPTLDLSRYMIEKHHSRYQTLYPEFPMTPKFHLMIHAPSYRIQDA
ncbi:uncharacterized protein LOC135937617 [Cloeon dipterum]|uniref:uncharacterized protein LOC135937617 n=1 Tax=Cloeon dipterum TaxID=197152 RepID=UPI003220A0DA